MPESIHIPFSEDYKSHYKDLSTASHEIMNYAATIGSTYQYIDTKYPETHDFKFWGNLGISINQLCSFMKQSSICRYCHFPQKDTVNIDSVMKLVSETLEECAYPDITSRINLSIANPQLSIYGDADHIAAAIYQLIVNAYEANDSSLPKDIDVSFSSDDCHLTISVSNYGMLTDNYSYEQLAQAFFTTKSNHAGCGLYIANIVCARHDGYLSIGCDNNITTVSLVLALKSK